MVDPVCDHHRRLVEGLDVWRGLILAKPVPREGDVELLLDDGYESVEMWPEDLWPRPSIHERACQTQIEVLFFDHASSITPPILPPLPRSALDY